MLKIEGYHLFIVDEMYVLYSVLYYKTLATIDVWRM